MDAIHADALSTELGRVGAMPSTYVNDALLAGAMLELAAIGVVPAEILPAPDGLLIRFKKCPGAMLREG
jgi:hypothetical protein